VFAIIKTFRLSCHKIVHWVIDPLTVIVLPNILTNTSVVALCTICPTFLIALSVLSIFSYIERRTPYPILVFTLNIELELNCILHILLFFRSLKNGSILLLGSHTKRPSLGEYLLSFSLRNFGEKFKSLCEVFRCARRVLPSFSIIS